MTDQPAPQTVYVEEKKTGTTYLLWFFLAIFSAHQFYMGNTKRALLQLFTAQYLLVGLFVDLFTIPRQVERANARLRSEAG